MNYNLTDIVVVLDRSGSMGTIKSDVEAGLNSFIDKQRQNNGEARITFVRFDNEIETVFTRTNIWDVNYLHLEPRNCTALYDAVGKTINNVGVELRNLPEYKRPSKVIFIIVTDGYENASREFTRSQVFDMIKHQRENYNWQFVFIGADMDAYGASANIGISQGSTINISKSPESIITLFCGLDNNVTQSRSMPQANFCAMVQNGNFWTDDDIKAQAELSAKTCV
jgi:uncharacterized protein YegL